MLPFSDWNIEIPPASQIFPQWNGNEFEIVHLAPLFQPFRTPCPPSPDPPDGKVCRQQQRLPVWGKLQMWRTAELTACGLAPPPTRASHRVLVPSGWQFGSQLNLCWRETCKRITSLHVNLALIQDFLSSCYWICLISQDKAIMVIMFSITAGKSVTSTCQTEPMASCCLLRLPRVHWHDLNLHLTTKHDGRSCFLLFIRAVDTDSGSGLEIPGSKASHPINIT